MVRMERRDKSSIDEEDDDNYSDKNTGYDE